MLRTKASIFRLMLIVLIPLLFAACENSTENKNPLPVNSDVFPNNVGDKWVYTVYDSLSNSYDTLTVDIVGTTTGHNKTLKIWLYRSHIYNDSMFVNVSNDTVYFYQDSYANLTDHEFVFPLSVNKYWYNTDLQSDSTIVKDKEAVTIPFGSYPDAYKLERRWGSFNVYGYSETWFVNNVGIVKMYRRILGFDNIKEIWELINFTTQ